MPQVTPAQIHTATHAALVAHGASDHAATLVARATADSEAHGNTICGLSYVESYCAALETGRVDGTATPVVSTPRPGAVTVDAAQGFAQPAFDAGLQSAVAAARTNGIASLAVAHSHTCTSLGYFTAQIAAAGLVGLGFTNASPVVAPPGGAKPALGTNPIALSVPGDGKMALHFDSSTSAAALGAIKEAKAAGTPIPSGWCVDENGDPTTDPAAALRGGILPLGGAKGFGFGVMAEVMAAALTGSVNSVDVAGLKLGDGPPHDLGQFYVLIDPGTHTDHWAARIARLAGAVSDQPGARLPGSTRVPMDTVAVPDALWDRITALA
ncbi:Ldh family oxidoreductase [Yoonia sp. R2331]|uniref:Ldh family oxidoreductase n=1 Tax=Yoonia sp. R2331 TaxID=3237238 RepID=UPI0034E56082